MSDIKAALAAMRADAQLWDTAADDMQGPISAVGGVAVTAADVSMWAADRGLAIAGGFCWTNLLYVTPGQDP